ncbi:hypothetical protein VTG60DRAFT_5471 [Thermothelomyces hinnuleus]
MGWRYKWMGKGEDPLYCLIVSKRQPPRPKTGALPRQDVASRGRGFETKLEGGRTTKPNATPGATLSGPACWMKRQIWKHLGGGEGGREEFETKHSSQTTPGRTRGARRLVYYCVHTSSYALTLFSGAYIHTLHALPYFGRQLPFACSRPFFSSDEQRRASSTNTAHLLVGAAIRETAHGGGPVRG